MMPSSLFVAQRITPCIYGEHITQADYPQAEGTEMTSLNVYLVCPTHTHVLHPDAFAVVY